jgi:AcrR family transcriptional regulator
MKPRAQKYTSDRLQARRAKILEETRKLIADKGLDAVNMRDLAENSGVALATLYNNFGDKEALVAEAVGEFFLSGTRQNDNALDKGVIAALDADLKSGVEESFRNPQYAAVMAFAYFKGAGPGSMHSMLHENTMRSFTPIIQSIQDRGELEDWVSPEFLAHEIIEGQYAVYTEWARGAFGDDALEHRLRTRSFMTLLAACKGALKEEIRKKLQSSAKKAQSDQLA